MASHRVSNKLGECTRPKLSSEEPFVEMNLQVHGDEAWRFLLPCFRMISPTENTINLLISMKYPLGVQRKQLKEKAVNLVNEVLEDYTDTLSDSSRCVC